MKTRASYDLPDARKKISNATLIAIAALLLAALQHAAPPAGATGGFSGAIFTSLGDGTTVNANIYDNRADVYLNGGPQNQNAAGLPDGVYYFQVTNPSGSVLLSTDDARCRQLQVVNGVVAGSFDDGGLPTCAHANGSFNMANNSTPVQLFPFDFTPNPGGEYKAWLIRQTATTSIDLMDPRVIHFENSDAKTDNFKVRETSGGMNLGIMGTKYHDLSFDGVRDPNTEGPLADFTIQVNFTEPGGNPDSVSTTTGQDGMWSLAFPAGTTYTACEVAPAGWLQTGPNDGATAFFKDANGDPIVGVTAATAAGKCWSGTAGRDTNGDPQASDTGGLDFGNIRVSRIGGTKYYDPDSSGTFTAGDSGLAGIKLTVTATLPNGGPDGETIFTGGGGAWASKLYPEGTTYTVCETLPNADWAQTGPLATAQSNPPNAATVNAGRCWGGTVGATDTSALDFFNVCRLTPGGRTIGFWSNRNGQGLLTKSDFVELNALNLRNADGTNRDFPCATALCTNTQFNSSKTLYRDWLLSANATNMAYMLSAQLSATKLNVIHDFTEPTVIVDGTRDVTQEIAYANSLLANPIVGGPFNGQNGGLTTSAGPLRTEQERVKNILDLINNQGSFVQPTACPFTTPY